MSIRAGQVTGYIFCLTSYSSTAGKLWNVRISFWSMRVMTAGTNRRINEAVSRGSAIEIIVDGRPLRAFLGESVAAALLADGKRALRRTERKDEPRGFYCGIGVCF